MTAQTTNHNVNNWHWVTKNCMPWSKDYLKKHLELLEANGTKIKEVSSIKGDVDLNVRKGKLKYIFDLEFDIKYEAADGGEGTIHLQDVICDMDDDDDCTIEVKGPQKEQVRKELLPKVFEVILKKFPADLLAANGDSMISSQQPVKSQGSSEAAKEFKKSAQDQKQVKPSAYKKSIITTTSEFKCPKQELIAAFFDVDRVKAWTRDPSAKVELKEGSQWSILGGSVYGSIQKIQDDTITFTWSLKSWSQYHYEPSEVVMKFSQGSDSTEVVINQSNVPFVEEAQIKQNWEDIYFNRIKGTFGYTI